MGKRKPTKGVKRRADATAAGDVSTSAGVAAFQAAARRYLAANTSSPEAAREALTRIGMLDRAGRLIMRVR